MTKVSFAALDDAEKVVANDRDGTTEIVAWYGGTTFNVYRVYNGDMRETGVFHVSDKEGKPIDRETAEKHMRQHLSE